MILFRILRKEFNGNITQTNDCIKLSMLHASSQSFLHCALAAAQRIVIGPVCGFVGVFVCLCVCCHDNAKFCASILTKLGSQVKIVTISS